METRIKCLLRPDTKRERTTRQSALAAIVLAVGLLIPLASLRPVSGSQEASPPTAPAPKPFVIVIDPGHGGSDTGMIGLDGTREKDINLAVAQKLRDALVKRGATVFLTRSGDTFLPVMARPATEAAHRAQYFVSIHCGMSWPANKNSGAVVYFHGASVKSQFLASDVADQIKRAAALPSATVQSDTTRFPNGFGVLRGSKVPAVLVECGFLNNARDLAALHQEATQQRIADGIAAGVADFDATYSSPAVKAKIDFMTAVHAHNMRLVQFWDSVARESRTYQRAVELHRPALIASLLAPRYVFNGRVLDKAQAVEQFANEIHRYGTRQYGLRVINSKDQGDSVVAQEMEHWGAGKDGMGGVMLSRRDVWTKTPTGWCLAASEVLPAPVR